MVWDVNPILLDLGPIQLRWYGLLWAIGIYAVYLIQRPLYKMERWPEEWLDTLFVWIASGAIIGARVGHCVFYEWHNGVNPYLQNPLLMLRIWEGGLASHGGTIGILIACICVYCRTMRPYMERDYRKPRPERLTPQPRNWYEGLIFIVDRLCIGVCICGALIRLGNFFNSEIYGGPTDLPWGVIFVRDGQTVPCHPTQLYEMLYCLAAFCVTWPMFTRWKLYRRPGLIFGVFLEFIFGVRFLLEFIKNNQEAFEDSLMLNMGQILSIPFILWGFWLIGKALLAPANAE